MGSSSAEGRLDNLRIESGDAVLVAASELENHKNRTLLPASERFWLGLQRVCGWVCLLPLSLIVILLVRFRGYFRINQHAKIRREFSEIARAKSRLIICCNHLTLIDSVILLWAFASPLRYFFHYRLYSWNLPAVENATRHFSWRVITYLSKCIFINRLGDAKHTGTLIEKVCYLLRSGESIMIFPEGTRSRTGRVEPQAVNYGIGRILDQIPDCQVLCVYMRGRQQSAYSDFPKRGEVFDINMQLIKPATRQRGLRALRDLSLQVISKIEEMEQSYFATGRSA